MFWIIGLEETEGGGGSGAGGCEELLAAEIVWRFVLAAAFHDGLIVFFAAF